MLSLIAAGVMCYMCDTDTTQGGDAVMHPQTKSTAACRVRQLQSGSSQKILISVRGRQSWLRLRFYANSRQ